jgi:gamma-glutamyl phosphate reductase
VDQKVDVAKYVQELGIAARGAARELARADTAAKNRALEAMASEIRKQAKAILAANEEDVKNTKGRDPAFIDRLRLAPKLVEIRSAASPTRSAVRPASRWRACACRSAWSASSTSPGRT